jgi:hypothetical protein
MSTHPNRCDGCAGSGWATGPTIHETVNGHPHPYPTVILCDHPWWKDDPGWDPFYDEPLPSTDQRGYEAGKAELAPHVQRRVA